jgi:hypothetical protein
MTKENKNKHHHHNQHDEKEKQRITMVCSWFYTGYEKKPNSWIEQKREYTRMRRNKKERERKLLRAHKTVKGKKNVLVFLFNKENF